MGYYILYLIGVAIFLLAQLGYMWMATWNSRSRFDWVSCIAMIIPLVGLLGCAVYAVAIRNAEVGSVISLGTLVITGFLCTGSVVWAYVLSIKKYREEDEDPSFAAFGVSCAYSLCLFATAFVFAL